MSRELTANVIDYDYTPSTDSYLVQGVKGNRTPKGSVAGSNGSFIMAGNPPEMNIEIAYSNDASEYINIYPIIKYNTPRQRVTKKYCKDIFNEIVDEEIIIPEGENVKSYIYEALEDIVKKAIETLD